MYCVFLMFVLIWFSWLSSFCKLSLLVSFFVLGVSIKVLVLELKSVSFVFWFGLLIVGFGLIKLEIFLLMESVGGVSDVMSSVDKNIVYVFSFCVGLVVLFMCMLVCWL